MNLVPDPELTSSHHSLSAISPNSLSTAWAVVHAPDSLAVRIIARALLGIPTSCSLFEMGLFTYW